MTILIIGGGLSGLYAAWRLNSAGEDVLVLEARDRPGGRILSEPASTGDTRFDLGPTWFWPEFQPKLPALLTDLGVPSFPQWTHGDMLFEPSAGGVQTVRPPDMGPSASRIRGGIAAVTDALVKALPEPCLRLNCTAKIIKSGSSAISVETTTGNFTGDSLLLALPPRLINETISFEPVLPTALSDTCKATPTWMAAHAKIIVVYEQAFWRDAGLSGQTFSYQGPMMEVHDASPDVGGPHALFGFIGLPAQDRRGQREAVINKALDQLHRLFGDAARNPLDVLYKDWSDDPLTAVPDDLDGPADHPDYGIPPTAYEAWPGTLGFIGSEAALQNGGYLEGCLEAVDQWLQSRPGV